MPPAFDKLVAKKIKNRPAPPDGSYHQESQAQKIRNQRNPTLPYGAKPDYWTRDRYGRRIPHFSTGQPGAYGNKTGRGRA